MSSRDNIELNNVRNGMKDKHDNILVEESEQISSLDVKMLQNIRTTYYQTFDRYDEFEKVKRNFKTTAPIFPKTNSQTSEMIEKLALQLGKPTNKRWFGVRHIQVFLAFYLMFIAYGLRVNLSVGIVAMTDPKASPNPEIPTFPEWKDTSVILSSFFWGYLPPQAFAGQLAKRYGPKWFLVSAMLICCLFTYLLPVLATKYGSAGVMFCRIMQGVGQGFVYPMIHDLLSKWVPPSERSRMGTYVYAGGSLGTVVSMLLTGILSGSWWGWPSVFYTYGTITLIWILLMAYLGSNDPSEHKFIKEEEKLYIEKGSARTIGEKCPTPWKDIFTSWPVWSLIVVHCGQNWGFWTLMTEIPSYISGVMEYEIESNSYLSGLPYFTLWVLSFIFSAIADFLINRKITSIGATRKILNSIGLFVPAASLIALGFMTKERKEAAIALLTIGVGTNAAIYSGFNINHIDIAPNHSGILMAISNGASNVCALIAPLFVQVVVTDQKDATQWRIVFMFTASLYVVTNCVFLIFGTGELQDWNEPKHKRKANDIFRTAQISVPPQPTIKTC